MSVPRTIAVLAILAVLLGVWLGVTATASQVPDSTRQEQPVDSSESIQLLRSDADGISFSVQVSSVEVVQETLSEIEYDAVSIPSFGSTADAGSPQVPARRILLGIPLGAEYELRVFAGESETVPGSHRLPPAPTPSYESDPQASPEPNALAPNSVSWRYTEDASIYATDALYPEAIARIADSGFIRDQRFVAVEVNPVQYNPVSGELILHKQFTVELSFTYQPGAEVGVSQTDSSFEPVLSASLFNYESASHWRGKPATVTSTTPEVDLRASEPPALKIMVDEDGIYQVTAADLEALEVPVGAIPTTTYKLKLRDREVPIRVFETAGGAFESFLFYGEQARTKYTDTNVYWLTYALDSGGVPGLRMQVSSVLPTSGDVSPYYSDTVRLEEDHTYRPDMPSVGYLEPDPWDHWFWTYTYDPYLLPDHPPQAAFTTQINHLSSTAYTATLRAFLSGSTSFWQSEYRPNHCVDFLVNGEKVGQHIWNGAYSEELVSYTFSSDRLLEGTNTVEVHACETPAPYDIVYYDWFEIDVRRDYQVQDDWLAFEAAEGDWQYLLEGFSTPALELFDVSGTYTVSYLIDADVDGASSPYSLRFYDAAAVQGTRYLALSQDQIKSPPAIVEATPSTLRDTANQADYIIIAPKEFVPDVEPLVNHRESQGLSVQVVELEPIFDEFNFGIYSPEAIHDFLAYAFHSWDKPAPTYVLLVGDGTYDFKDHLGLGSANLVPPYLAPVDPELGETAADNRYVTVAGDDLLPEMLIGRFPAQTSAHVQAMVEKTIAYESNPAPREWAERILFVTDDDETFYGYSDDLVNDFLPEPYVPIKAYLEDTCADGAQCRQIMLETLNGTGALLVNYIGHGAIPKWTGNDLWDIADLSSLESTTRFPVMLPMTCLEGAFHWAERDSLAEATVRLDGRGAVASWSPSGMGTAFGHDFLNKGFFQATLYNGVRQLGAAALAGKVKLLEEGYGTSLDLIDTYNLLGDPALRLNPLVDVAVGQTIAAPEAPRPGDSVTITLTFTNMGPGTESGVVLTDLLPPMLVKPSMTYSGPAEVTLKEGTMLAWTLDGIPPGASGEIAVEATVDPDWLEPEVSFFNRARITPLSYDQEPANNLTVMGVNLKSVYLPLVFKRY